VALEGLNSELLPVQLPCQLLVLSLQVRLLEHRVVVLSSLVADEQLKVLKLDFLQLQLLSEGTGLDLEI